MKQAFDELEVGQAIEGPRFAVTRVTIREFCEASLDVAVRNIVMKAFERATDILRARRADLEDGTRLLLERETLTADQFPAIQQKTKQPEQVG